jgi:hypothetical protein
MHQVPRIEVGLGSGTVLQQRSVAGPLYQLIAVVVAAVPKMPALCQMKTRASQQDHDRTTLGYG